MSLLVSAVLVAGLFTSRELVNPPAIVIEPSRNTLQLAGAAMAAASSAGWRAELKDPETIKATYSLNGHSAEVQIKVSPASVAVSYVGSSNLSYSNEGGKQEIHKVYLEWIKRLMERLTGKMHSLCTDLTPIAATSTNVGQTFADLTKLYPQLSSVDREQEIHAQSGVATGYVIRQYVGFLPDSRVEECAPVSAVFYDEKFVTIARTPLEQAALAAYSDELSYLVEHKKISFGDAELERINLKVDTVTPLDAPRKEELLRFVEWQTQRLEKSTITRQEYDYLLAQKESELMERQHSIEAKDAELDLMRQQRQQQSAALDIQRQQLSAQRSMAVSQALSNLSNSLAYRPYVSCTTSSFGNTAHTLCH